MHRSLCAMLSVCKGIFQTVSALLHFHERANTANGQVGINFTIISHILCKSRLQHTGAQYLTRLYNSSAFILWTVSMSCCEVLSNNMSSSNCRVPAALMMLVSSWLLNLLRPMITMSAMKVAKHVDVDTQHWCKLQHRYSHCACVWCCISRVQLCTYKRLERFALQHLMIASGVIPISYSQEGCDNIRLFEFIAMLFYNLWHGKQVDA